MKIFQKALDKFGSFRHNFNPSLSASLSECRKDNNEALTKTSEFDKMHNLFRDERTVL